MYGLLSEFLLHYLMEYINIWHIGCLLCVDDKGGWKHKHLFHFLMGSVYIWHNENLWYVDDQKGLGYLK